MPSGISRFWVRILVARRFRLSLRSAGFRSSLYHFQANVVGIPLSTRNSRVLRRPATILCEMSLILSRENFIAVAGVAAGADHFALRDQCVLDAPEHLLIADAFAPHVLAVLSRSSRTSFVQPVFCGEIVCNRLRDGFGRGLRIRTFKQGGAQAAHQLPRKIADKLSGNSIQGLVYQPVRYSAAHAGTKAEAAAFTWTGKLPVISRQTSRRRSWLSRSLLRTRITDLLL